LKTDPRKTPEGIAILNALAVAEARKSFWAYRRFMFPKMKLGWWQREVTAELQRFYDEMTEGRRPKMVIEAPPQHGKSRMIVEFVSWIAGKNPDLKVIYASFSDHLGLRANRTLQHIYVTSRYRMIFPGTQTNLTAAASSNAAPSARTQSIIEYVGREGSFRNTTVSGAINGETLDLGVIDDPIKSREEAGSKTIRDKTWDWFTDDFMTRFSENAGMLAILTRWHVDDPIGRLKAELGDAVRVVSYPAIAVRDEKHRQEGEALFPEHKSLDFLLGQKRIMASVNWEAQYQQTPQIIGGQIIRGQWFGRYKVPPILKRRVIYADTAQKTAERNDYSVFECWGKGADGKIYLLDMIRGKWEAPELKRRAIAFWNKHKALDSHKMGTLRELKVEDKASGTGLIQELKSQARIPVVGVERVKDKLTRIMDVLGYIESGYVLLPEDAAFTNDFVAECEAFTADDSHLHDDQVDPMIDAIADMLARLSKAEIFARIL
jgi:predicted phage terminase large subunit-like protein